MVMSLAGLEPKKICDGEAQHTRRNYLKIINKLLSTLDGCLTTSRLTD
jgi:hypothetical protein